MLREDQCGGVGEYRSSPMSGRAHCCVGGEFENNNWMRCRTLRGILSRSYVKFFEFGEDGGVVGGVVPIMYGTNVIAEGLQHVATLFVRIALAYGTNCAPTRSGRIVGQTCLPGF